MKNKNLNKLFLALLGLSLYSVSYDTDTTAKASDETSNNARNQAVILKENKKDIANINNDNLTAKISNNTLTEETSEQFVLTTDEYKRKSASELADLVREKKVTSEQLVKIAFEVIKEENPKLNAVLATREKEALEEAKKLDSLEDGDKNKPFFGVPTLMKGFGHDVKDLPNTYGYTYNKDSVAKRDSNETKKYKDLGFVVLGNTNYPEGSMRNITDSTLYGATKNPLNTEHNAGGSSGGSAAAVASGMVPIASGSDIGGSIRIPASWTGLIGLKPTSYGGYAVHFPLVRSVKDAQIFFENTLDKIKYKQVEVDDIKKLKIGYTTTVSKGMEPSKEAIEAVDNAVKFLKEQGFEVEEITYPLDGDHMLAEYTHVATSGNKNLDKILKSKKLTKYDVDPLTWALHVYSKDLDTKEANKLRKNSVKELEKQAKIMAEFHKKYPIILTPTNAKLAPLNTDYYVEPTMREILYNFDQVPKEKRYETLVKQWEPMFKRTPYTLISNLTKEPTISLPTYMSENNLPLGIMLNGGVGYDSILLKFAKIFEDNNKFKMNPTIMNKLWQKGTSISAKENTLQAVLKSEKIPYKTSILEEIEQKPNTEKTIQEGTDGRIVTATYIKDGEVEKTEVLSKIDATNKVVSKGVGVHKKSEYNLIEPELNYAEKIEDSSKEKNLEISNLKKQENNKKSEEVNVLDKTNKKLPNTGKNTTTSLLLGGVLLLGTILLRKLNK